MDDRKSLIEKLVASFEDGKMDASEAADLFEDLADDLEKAARLLDGWGKLALVGASQACDYAAKKFRELGSGA